MIVTVLGTCDVCGRPDQELALARGEYACDGCRSGEVPPDIVKLNVDSMRAGDIVTLTETGAAVMTTAEQIDSIVAAINFGSIDARRDSRWHQLAEPRMRALREQYGLPREMQS